MKVALFKSITGRYTTVCDERMGALMLDCVRISEWTDIHFEPRADLAHVPEIAAAVRQKEAS